MEKYELNLDESCSLHFFFQAERKGVRSERRINYYQCKYFIKDVTDEYATTTDPVFPVLSEKRERKEKYAYLAVFDNAKWIPICFSEIKDSKQITFDKIEKGAVYPPVYYINGRGRPFNYPALLNENGELEFLNPDNSSKRDISLKRKYP